VSAPVDHDARIDAMAREADLLAEALAAGPRDARVPSCPEWTVDELALHVGRFTGFWAHVLCEGTGRPKPPAPDPPPGGDLGEWYRPLAAALVEELRATPTGTEVWTWMPDDQTPAFVARRAAHELAVHRVDAQLARGGHTPIEAELAADGIDEVVVLVQSQDDQPRGQGETLHLHGTDRGDEWLLALTPDGLQVERTHGKADLALRGGVSDLELVLYHRPPVAPVEHLGDDAVLAAWQRAFTF
jgi:uncharacterized protein (TIGR03083 family)